MRVWLNRVHTADIMCGLKGYSLCTCTGVHMYLAIHCVCLFDRLAFLDVNSLGMDLLNMHVGSMRLVSTYVHTYASQYYLSDHRLLGRRADVVVARIGEANR